ncbi:hypothetical protein [Nitrosarchaeum sp. AC2]|uniref:hypothetical protein n=1 Tax=Nitrosarchaeum sp. AC2 TaxID=2259673 RepID=UPI0015CB0EF3|nr:hypothetical protein [Nitrosarchaeum sp. AC2]
MKYFVIFFLILLSAFSLNEVSAEQVFSKDAGAGLTPEECQKRYDNSGGFFEPLYDLAKFKAQNHPVFRQLTENDSFQIVSTGVQSSPYSENCDMDLPTFEIHYATNMTDNSYTRIYMSIDNTTYDITEIRTRLIDSPVNESPTSEPLPFYNTNWNEAFMEGVYHRSDPPKPSQTFKIPYIAVNGKITNFKTDAGTITAQISANEWAIFAVKIPRNYPYTDHNDLHHPSHGLEVFAMTNDSSDLFPHVTRDDCFYNVWMRIPDSKTIEMPLTLSYLQGDPMHGDGDLPPFCKSKTIVDEKRDKIAKLSPLKQVENGIFPYDVSCKDGLYLLVKHDKSPACISYNVASKLWDRGWADKSTDIYTEYSLPETVNNFNSKLKDEKDVLQIVDDFIDTTNLVLRDPDNPDFRITANLAYVDSYGNAMLNINNNTGLPTQIAGFDNEGFYRTPNWYAELQKDYLGMPSNRIEHGNVAWEVSYRECRMCFDYSTFVVDAITGEIIDTYKVENMFGVKNNQYERK